MAGINTFSATLTHSISWNAQNNLTGTNYQPLTNAGSFSKQQAYSQATANAALGGADQFVSYLITLAASANTTVDLSTLTNILQQASVTVARTKGWIIRLLNATDDATNGTACSSVTVGNAASNPFLFNGWAGTTPTQDIKTGGSISYFDASAAGYTIGSNKNVKIVNNDGALAACVQLTLILGST